MDKKLFCTAVFILLLSSKVVAKDVTVDVLSVDDVTETLEKILINNNADVYIWDIAGIHQNGKTR